MLFKRRIKAEEGDGKSRLFVMPKHTLTQKLTEKPKKNGKIKGIAKGSRFVLFIGDEGAIMLHMRNNKVLNRQFVTDTSDANLKDIRSSLAIDSQATISMIIDNFDQTYVQQTLPPVSAMSVKKLIKRRLERDFSATTIKNALLLGRETSGRKDWNFLMIAIERNPSISEWLRFIYSVPNHFSGIYLAAVEVENVIKRIEKSMGAPKAGTGSQWKFFISHNKVGGFRQVILRDGRIVFTRMAQPIGDSSPEVIAGNIEQEMLSTIEYMKRLSYIPSMGLDIYIIAGSAIKPILDKSKFEAKNFTILSPFEAAQYLDIEGGTQPSDQFGDVILAASISSSTKHVLTFTTTESNKFQRIYRFFQVQRVLAALVVIGLVGYAAMVAVSIFMQYQSQSEIESRIKTQQTRLNTLKEDITKSGIDIDKSADIMSLYQALISQRASPTELIEKINTVIKSPTTIKSIEWVYEDKNTNKPAAAKPKIKMTLELIVNNVQNADDWKRYSKQLLIEVKAVFKGYEADFTNVPKIFTEGEKLDLNFEEGSNRTTPNGEDYVVKLVIKEL
jgi:hypothetical protein